MKFYFLRDKKTDVFSAGTGKHAVPKLYSLGSAKSARSNIRNFWRAINPYDGPNYEIVPVTITLEKPLDD